MSSEPDLAAPIKRLADLDLSDTKGDAAHYDDANSNYHHQLYTGPIVDPHVHLFNFEQLSYPWLKGPNQIGKHPLVGNIDSLRQRSYLIADLEADAKRHNVVKWVYVQAEAEDGIKEAEYVEVSCKRRAFTQHSPHPHGRLLLLLLPLLLLLLLPLSSPQQQPDPHPAPFVCACAPLLSH